MRSVVQDWVAELGLRHQGVLMSAVRGCDSVSKEDASKPLIRAYRSYVLYSFDKTPSSFIDFVSSDELTERMGNFLGNFDHYPIHFVLHLLHASEIVGYHHPDMYIRRDWRWFYEKLVKKMHLTPESKTKLDQRLGACEADFAAERI